MSGSRSICKDSPVTIELLEKRRARRGYLASAALSGEISSLLACQGNPLDVFQEIKNKGKRQAKPPEKNCHWRAGCFENPVVSEQIGEQGSLATNCLTVFRLSEDKEFSWWGKEEWFVGLQNVINKQAKPHTLKKIIPWYFQID